jgi:hypothetical protein
MTMDHTMTMDITRITRTGRGVGAWAGAVIGVVVGMEVTMAGMEVIGAVTAAASMEEQSDMVAPAVAAGMAADSGVVDAAVAGAVRAIK